METTVVVVRKDYREPSGPLSREHLVDVRPPAGGQGPRMDGVVTLVIPEEEWSQVDIGSTYVLSATRVVPPAGGDPVDGEPAEAP